MRCALGARTQGTQVKYSEAFTILKELGAGEFAHINGDLEAQLIGTHDLLRDWGNTEYVCAAGLYHAVYGTDGLQSGFVELCDRPLISSIIGPESEELVFFMPRATESMCTHR
jgi:hypothetical protein